MDFMSVIPEIKHTTIHLIIWLAVLIEPRHLLPDGVDLLMASLRVRPEVQSLEIAVVIATGALVGRRNQAQVMISLNVYSKRRASRKSTE